MPRAGVNGPGWGGREAFGNPVRDMPGACALAVIFFAKASSEPPRDSAMATAMSLAERVTTARIASRTLMVSPGFRPSFDGACAAAWAEIGIVEESETLPASIASNRRYNVIILVSEAG